MILDVRCKQGVRPYSYQLYIALYSHFFKALVTATDVSEDMVAMANKATGDVSNMTTMVADAQNLETFEESSMDVVCI